jgi:hypothetical protein
LLKGLAVLPRADQLADLGGSVGRVAIDAQRGSLDDDSQTKH